MKKLDPKTLEGIFVGIDTEMKAWRISWENQVVCKRDVTFVEDVFPWKDKRASKDSTPIKVGDEYKSKYVENLPLQGDVFEKDPLSNNIPHKHDEAEPTEDNEWMYPNLRRSARGYHPSRKILVSVHF